MLKTCFKRSRQYRQSFNGLNLKNETFLSEERAKNLLFGFLMYIFNDIRRSYNSFSISKNVYYNTFYSWILFLDLRAVATDLLDGRGSATAEEMSNVVWKLVEECRWLCHAFPYKPYEWLITWWKWISCNINK